MTDADYLVDLVLQTNTPAQAESLLRNLEQAVASISLSVDTNKTEFLHFKQKEATSTTSG